jgi:S-adenosyl methyltransferase
MYDVYLGGKDNFEVDREAAARVAEQFPEVPLIARANKTFAVNVAGVMAETTSQLIDLGTGIPSEPTVHGRFLQVCPGASVVGVDNDPVVLVQGSALGPKGAHIVGADIRDPAAVFEAVGPFIDWSRPVTVLAVAVLHFVGDAEVGGAGPAGIIAAFRERMVAGSAFALSHACHTGSDQARVEAVERAYSDKADAGIVFRAEDEIRGYLADTGFSMLSSGVGGREWVDVQHWRTAPGITRLPVQDLRVLCGLGLLA